MARVNRKGDKISDEKRQELIDEIVSFFTNERDEKIGVLAAEQILNFFLDKAGADIYNKGVYDAKAAIERQQEELYYDLDDLLDLN
ncbi:DUF2164 domain-containing protein [Cryomorphaceae bacterium 1068]|nr:DUF2164 domain-containing protein [Cryomorphaceae bacterium 1068]